MKRENIERDKTLKQLKDENKYLHLELQKTKGELHDLQQYGRNQNIEVHGIEERKGENVMEMITDMAKKLRLPTDIDVAHWLPNQEPTQAILNNYLVSVEKKSR